MAQQFDLIIRGGTVIDGSGGDPQDTDVAIKDGRIVAIGRSLARADGEIDARGLIVTPGFVDIHTHYDGQATWQSRMSPSSDHGVTTVVAGNCGVGFAPCRPADRDDLVRVMEGVEDIPEAVMAEGLSWTWESFPDYLDMLARREFDVDIAIHVPHAALRVWVMGQRGVNCEPATATDIDQMRTLVAEGVRAGAVGVSTSRSLLHRTKAGDGAPTIHAAADELLGLADGLRDAGRGVFQIIPNMNADPNDEFDLFERLVARAKQPLSFSLMQTPENGNSWKGYLARLNGRPEADVPIRGQVFPRPIGVLLGLDLSFNPFSLNPSFQKIAGLPLAEKVAAMRNSDLRLQILSEQPSSNNPFQMMLIQYSKAIFPLTDPPRYDPKPSESVAAIAELRGMTMLELAYDLLLEQDGRQILYVPIVNYADGTLDAVREMLDNPRTILGLGDGGAHYGTVCDSSFPTYMLSWWARDAPPGQRIDLARAVHELSMKPAEALRFSDRGSIRIGAKADFNVIDFDKLGLRAPTPVFDLPAGGRRLIQKATGYRATIVGGATTYANGTPTQSLTGRLLRSSTV